MHKPYLQKNPLDKSKARRFVVYANNQPQLNINLNRTTCKL